MPKKKKTIIKFTELFSKHPQELLTSDEVCMLLRISLRTLYRIIKRGELPYNKVGQTYRFRVAEVKDYYLTIANPVSYYFKPEILLRYNEPSVKYTHQKEPKGGGWLIFRDIPGRPGATAYVRYHERTLPYGEKVLMLTRNQFERLPEQEKLYWREFEIP
ncbi:MAG: helix-turn-helix domain-containing protein [Planctomycetota bacterium]